MEICSENIVFCFRYFSDCICSELDCWISFGNRFWHRSTKASFCFKNWSKVTKVKMANEVIKAIKARPSPKLQNSLGESLFDIITTYNHVKLNLKKTYFWNLTIFAFPNEVGHFNSLCAIDRFLWILNEKGILLCTYLENGKTWTASLFNLIV